MKKEQPKDWKDSTKALMEAYGDNPKDFPYDQPKQTIDDLVKEYKEEYIHSEIFELGVKAGYNHSQTEIEELRREMFANMNKYAYYFERCYAERPMKTPLSPSEWFEQQLITKHK